MRKIKKKLRTRISEDPQMRVCIYWNDNAPNHDCDGRIEWEHAFIYAGKQINEEWAIVGCCTAHNRSDRMVKEYNQFIALQKAKKLGCWEEILRKYPRTNWNQLFYYLTRKYGKD